MNILAMTGFLDSLIQDTLSCKISWKSLTELKGVSEEHNKALYNTLLENEFHSVLFFKSFYCLLPSSGYVYLINETSESGYDGSIISGLNIYIQKDCSSKIHQLTVDLSQIYQLENAIISSRSTQDEEIQDFIDNYYKYLLSPSDFEPDN